MQPSCSGTLSSNTVVIYVGDNGMLLGEHYMRGKRAAFEESIRVPLLIAHPGTISAGQSNSEMVALVDITPTILEYAGVGVPASMHGRTLGDVADGTPATDWRAAVHLQYHSWEASTRIVPWYALRTDRYELIYHYGQEWGGSREWELIDLETDPGELTNVHHDEPYAGVVSQLESELVSVQTTLGIPPVVTGCPGDMNRDGVITMTDVLSVWKCFGLPAGGACALTDITGDGFVTTSDYLLTARAFGQSCAQ